MIGEQSKENKNIENIKRNIEEREKEDNNSAENNIENSNSNSESYLFMEQQSEYQVE